MQDDFQETDETQHEPPKIIKKVVEAMDPDRILRILNKSGIAGVGDPERLKKFVREITHISGSGSGKDIFGLFKELFAPIEDSPTSDEEDNIQQR